MCFAVRTGIEPVATDRQSDMLAITPTNLVSSPLHLTGKLILLSAPKYFYHQTLCSDGLDQSSSYSLMSNSFSFPL
jgi:hypothetical protein